MAIDIEPYMKDLESFDMTDEQKREYLTALAQIVQHFVDKAFGKHPIQLALRERADKK